MSDSTVSSSARAGLEPDIDVIVVGAGLAGLCALHHLRQAGWRCRLYDTASEVGGTWYWNRYPGARVDVESVEYSYAFDDDLQQDWEWSERYAAQPELLRYFNHVADRFELRQDIVLDTRVDSVVLDESNDSWTVTTGAGEVVRTRYVVLATGMLSASSVPTLPGADRYAGEIYHTSSWPARSVDFTGKRVAVIGTGSSGIQVIQEAAKEAHELTVLQRTATFAVPLRNGPMLEEYARRVKASYGEWRAMQWASLGGFVATGLEARPGETRLASEVTSAERRDEFEFRWTAGGLCLFNSFPDLLFDQQSNDALADFVREKIRERVKDPETAELLTPRGFPIMAKRLCTETDYYDVYNQDNVRLVDISATPITELTERGLVVDGCEIEVDAIVWATGFDAVTGPLFRMTIEGVDGLALRDHWSGGPSTHLGLMTAGFPNLFFVNGPQSPGAFFLPPLLSQRQSEWLVQVLGDMAKTGATRIETDAAAAQAWTDHVNDVCAATLFPKANSWYLGANIPGKPRVCLAYLGGFAEYDRRLALTREADCQEFTVSGRS